MLKLRIFFVTVTELSVVPDLSPSSVAAVAVPSAGICTLCSSLKFRRGVARGRVKPALLFSSCSPDGETHLRFVGDGDVLDNSLLPDTRFLRRYSGLKTTTLSGNVIFCRQTAAADDDEVDIVVLVSAMIVFPCRRNDCLARERWF